MGTDPPHRPSSVRWRCHGHSPARALLAGRGPTAPGFGLLVLRVAEADAGTGGGVAVYEEDAGGLQGGAEAFQGADVWCAFTAFEPGDR